MDDQEHRLFPSSAERVRRLKEIIIEWIRLADRQLDLTLEELDPAEERRLWELTAEGLRIFGEDVDQTTARGLATHFLPGTVRLLDYAAVGILEAVMGDLPRAWRPKGKSKERRKTRAQHVAIGYASAYYALVEQEGIIKDDNPTATICTLWEKGVAPSTARKFRKADNKLQFPVLFRAVGAVTGAPEDLARRQREEAHRVLRRAGRLYKRRVL